MCNGYPALRCSRHAKDLLHAAENKLDKAVNWHEQEEARKVLAHAQKVFYTTPAGFKELEEKIDVETNPLKKDELFGLLQDGKSARRNSQREYNRIHRVNKEKIANAKILRDSGLPWWVIASQLNVDSLEKEFDVSLVNKATHVKPQLHVEEHDENSGSYTINVREQNFDIEIGERKYLSINNRHSFTIYEHMYKNDTPVKNDILSITEKYADREDNKPIDFYELTYNQRSSLQNSVIQKLQSLGYTHIIVSDPKIGISNSFELHEMFTYFVPTLHTPLYLRNGTDNLTLNNAQNFYENVDQSLFTHAPEFIKNKCVIEAIEPLTNEQKYVNGYVLKELTGYLYEIKKIGNIRGESVRVLLTLLGEKSSRALNI